MTCVLPCVKCKRRRDLIESGDYFDRLAIARMLLFATCDRFMLDGPERCPMGDAIAERIVEQHAEAL